MEKDEKKNLGIQYHSLNDRRLAYSTKPHVKTTTRTVQLYSTAVYCTEFIPCITYFRLKKKDRKVQLLAIHE